MLISINELSNLLKATWNAAQESSYELKDQVIEELLSTFNTKKILNWELLKVEELRNLAAGKKIFHSNLGEGIVTIKNGEKFISFNGFEVELHEDDWPWNQSIQIL